MTGAERAEKRGLWLSIIGALFMAALGIGFAILTSSNAVLLDGLFSLVGFAIGLVSLRVATLVRRPDGELYHFGYAAYEPMLNLSKGLLMAFVTIFALVSAAQVVLQGGREIQAGWASVYAWIAAAGCFAIAFLVAVLLADTSYAHLLPYADPAVVIVLVVLSLQIPFKIIRDNWNQMLGRAPDEALQHRAGEAVAAAFDDSMEFDTTLRMQQIVRFTYLQIYVVCREGQAVDIDRLDASRSAVHDALRGHFENLALDVIFTHDPRWVAVAVGRDVISSGHETRGGSRL